MVFCLSDCRTHCNTQILDFDALSPWVGTFGTMNEVSGHVDTPASANFAAQKVTTSR